MPSKQRCLLCGYVSKTIKQQIAHRNTNHPVMADGDYILHFPITDKRRPLPAYTCGMCGQQFGRSEDFMDHTDRHEEVLNEIFKYTLENTNTEKGRN